MTDYRFRVCHDRLVMMVRTSFGPIVSNMTTADLIYYAANRHALRASAAPFLGD